MKKVFKNPLQGLHLAFMLFITGASKSIKGEILLNDCEQLPVQCAWVSVFARFWNNLTDWVPKPT